MRAVELLEESEESDWSPLTPQEVAKNLKDQIERLERNEKIDTHLLEVEFAVTSTLQEISMTNGWSKEYLKLAAEFDEEIEKIK